MSNEYIKKNFGLKKITSIPVVTHFMLVFLNNKIYAAGALAII